MKKIITAMLTLSMCISLCACGNKQNANIEDTVSKQKIEKTQESDATEKKKKELTKVAVGDKITVDFAEITIDECGIKNDIRQSVKTGNVTYTSGPAAAEGSEFVYVRGTIKNTSKAEISQVTFGGKAELDGYSYDMESINIIESNGNSSISLAPLMTYTYTLYAKIPSEIAASHESCDFSFGFDENFEWKATQETSDYKYGYTIGIQ